ncbi:hypothetical protein BKA80DRAFT_60241 [Phyllosticta citrichinensis]
MVAQETPFTADKLLSLIHIHGSSYSPRTARLVVLSINQAGPDRSQRWNSAAVDPSPSRCPVVVATVRVVATWADPDTSPWRPPCAWPRSSVAEVVRTPPGALVRQPTPSELTPLYSLDDVPVPASNSRPADDGPLILKVQARRPKASNASSASH